MTHPTDVTCPGIDPDTGDTCPDRTTCKRYLEMGHRGAWEPTINFFKPGNLFGCLEKIEQKEEP